MSLPCTAATAGLALWLLPTAAVAVSPREDRPRPADLVTYETGPLMQVGFRARAGGEMQRLTFSPFGITNCTLVSVGGKVAVFGSKEGHWEPQKTSLPAGKDGARRGMRSVWVYRDVRVTQDVEVVLGTSKELNACLVTYTLENRGKEAVAVGVRPLLDVYVVDNDAPAFDVPGRDRLIAIAEEFKAAEVPDFVRALQVADRKKPGLAAFLTLKVGRGLEAPDRFVIGRLPPNPEEWRMPAEDMRGDAAVSIYWGPDELAPGASRRVGYAYGLSAVRQ